MKGPSEDQEGSAKAIVEVALDAIVSMDQDGLVTEFNPAAEKTFGYARAEAVGRRLVDLILPPSGRHAHREGLERSLARGEAVLGKRIETTAMRADGTEFPVELTICPAWSEPPTFTGFIRDLSESRQAAQALRAAEERSRRNEVEAATREERERVAACAREAEQLHKRLASMLEATPDFVGYADARSAQVLYVNRAGRRMCGVPDDEDVTTLRIADFHPAWAHKRIVEEFLPGAARDGVCSGEVSFLHRDGHEIPTLMILMAHRGEDGKTEVYSTISRDITDRKRAEDVKRSLVREQAARAAAEEAVRVRDDFVATAGHELKTPLTSLLMHVSSMQRALRRGRSTDFADRLDKLALSGGRLAKLIDQLLDVSRITGGRLSLEPEAVDLAELVREVVARFAGESARAGTTLSVRADESVRGSWDPTRIDQVITNLLSNAVKYGHGKPVEIEVITEEHHASVRVVDHGIGIDPDHRQRLFGRFERAVSVREYGGLGLGLWIAREIVEASGGTISVESAPDCGSAFTFRLPLRADEHAHAVP
jgi:PAS domain S-box-containing protein